MSQTAVHIHDGDVVEIIDDTLMTLSTRPSDRASLTSLPLGAVDAVWSALAEVLSMPTNSFPRHGLAFVKDQQIHYPGTEAEREAFSRVATSVLQNLEQQHALFDAIAKRLTNETHPRVSVSAFVSQPASTRLGAHVDKWDNLVVQLKGCKAFLFEHEEIKLRAGDVLYVPEDVSHDVRTLEDSIHLSLVLLRPDSSSQTVL